MARLDIGPLVLLLPDAAGREITVKDFGGEERDALESPALVVGPDDLLLEAAYRRWDDGGMVVLLSRGDSAPAFDRLLHGERLGVNAQGDGTEFVEADLLRWDHQAHWGGSTMATISELDETMGAPVEAMLVEAGCVGFGTRAQVLSDAGKRRNRLCARFPATEPLGALAVYTLTRILPIARAVSRR
jgi:hypothetical protein